MAKLSAEMRSKIMRGIRNKDTRPEMIVRRLVHGLGYRYRLHASDLPGRPDLVFRPRRKVVFVHGCFWHQHPGCPNVRPPRSRLRFWRPKLDGNRLRDEENLRRLREAGWSVLVLWECELGEASALADRIVTFLEGQP
jgi:DNA mismatch endonuclease, patch repair protein